MNTSSNQSSPIAHALLDPRVINGKDIAPYFENPKVMWERIDEIAKDSGWEADNWSDWVKQNAHGQTGSLLSDAALMQKMSALNIWSSELFSRRAGVDMTQRKETDLCSSLMTQ